MARFRAIVCFEGIPTGDRRKIGVGSLRTRELPLTLMGMTVNPEMGGHGLAEVAGRLDSLTRVDASSWVDGATGDTWAVVAGGGEVFAWVGEGDFDEGEFGAKVEGLVREKTLRGVSVDLADVTSELDVLEVDDEGWPTDWLDTVTEGEISAATVCNTPAFRGCTIEVLVEAGSIPDPAAEVEPVAASADDEAPWLPAFSILADADCEPCKAGEPTVTVTAAGGPMAPPAAWFTNPAFRVGDGLLVEQPNGSYGCPLTVLEDGRVFGHLATWGTCHVGLPNCVTPPHSNTGYAMFANGAVRTAEGTEVSTGRITLGTGHADRRLGLAAAAAHYDDTGAVVADIACGDDEFGIWVAGALRPDATELQVRQLRAAPLSGDWRKHGRGLEMVAALAVNVPGFPIQRPAALVASGVVTSLVAAGALAQPSLHPADPSPAEALLAAVGRELLELRAERALARLAR